MLLQGHPSAFWGTLQALHGGVRKEDSHTWGESHAPQTRSERQDTIDRETSWGQLRGTQDFLGELTEVLHGVYSEVLGSLSSSMPVENSFQEGVWNILQRYVDGYSLHASQQLTHTIVKRRAKVGAASPCSFMCHRADRWEEPERL